MVNAIQKNSFIYERKRARRKEAQKNIPYEGFSYHHKYFTSINFYYWNYWKFLTNLLLSEKTVI